MDRVVLMVGIFFTFEGLHTIFVSIVGEPLSSGLHRPTIHMFVQARQNYGRTKKKKRFFLDKVRGRGDEGLTSILVPFSRLIFLTFCAVRGWELCPDRTGVVQSLKVLSRGRC